MTRPRLAVALAMAAVCSVAHRLQDQFGPGMMVPGHETAKFDDSNGTKSRAASKSGPAKAPG
jgi:hypothetical protein